jgi:hypothetical protein
MKNAMIFGLIFLLLALNCVAAPMQLSGDTGRSILGTIDNNTTKQTDSNNDSAKDLWSWGKVPVGHSINDSNSGKLDVNPLVDDGMVEAYPMSPTLN